jgi:hypothetical protein
MARNSFVKDNFAKVFDEFARVLSEESEDSLTRQRAQVRAQIAELQLKDSLLGIALREKATEASREGRPAQRPRDLENLLTAFGGAEEGAVRKPTLAAALIDVLRESSEPLRPVEIFSELAHRGLAPGGRNARNQLAARLSRMTAAGKLVRSNGRYTVNKSDITGGPPR